MLAALQTKNSTRNLDTENTSGKHAQPEESHTVLSQIDTLHCQQKELEHKGG